MAGQLSSSLPQVATQGVAVAQISEGIVDGPGPSLGKFQGLFEKFVEQQHLDATITQHLCEEVMVPLSLVHPGQSVEEEAVGIARGESA